MNSSKTSPSGCEANLLLGGRLQHPSPFTQAFLIFIILINILTFPFTAALNALVMIAVKVKSRLRAHNSNILLATLASTDFAVGILVQPAFIAVFIMILLEEQSGYCLLRFARPVISGLTDASLYHLVLISGERYLAMKHPFAYTTLVTEAHLLVASVLVWLLSETLQVLFLINLNSVVIRTKQVSVGLSIVCIIFCHVTVYRETRQHQRQLAAQQVTQDAREQFEKDKKALKQTSILILVLVLCYLPLTVFLIVSSRYRSELSQETIYIIFSIALWILFLNSLINPMIYSVRMRQFRVAFIELVCGTMNIAEAEEFEMRLFGAPNSVVQHKAGQEQEGRDQQNVEQANVNNNDNHNDDALQHENVVVEQPNNNS